MHSTLDMNSQRITNLGTPVLASDPATKSYVDTLFTGIGSVNFLTSAAVGVSVQAWDTDLDTWATKTPPSGIPVGTTDIQVLSSKEFSGTTLFSLGAVLSFDAGDVTITHGSNILNFAGATNGYHFDNFITPVSNDGTALGTASLSFSDLFLAEGGVINWDGGDVTVTQSGNSLTVAGGNLIFPGTATNDSAAAGVVGEIIESTVLVGSAVSLTTGTAVDVTSVSLTAGDWDVWGNIWFNAAGTTNVTQSHAAISTTTATLPTAPGAGGYNLRRQAAQVPAGAYGMPTGQTRLSLSATTTVYLVASSTFTVSTNAAFGYIGARRVR